MLGFNPISDHAISDISLPIITGVINTIDGIDTCAIYEQELVSGSISTTDGQDTANLIGSVSGTPIDTHDGFTKREIERARALDKKRRAAENKLIELRKIDAENRKQTLRGLVDPVAKTQQKKQNKVQSKQEIRIDTPSVEISRLESVIANLDRQEKELNQAIAHRKMLAETMTALAILDAKYKAEQDDEEALLMLL
jgi:hypothetical protein